MWEQVIAPTPNISCTPGLCLEYVRRTYNIGAKYTTATAAWNGSTTKHTDKNFPSGVWVPLWFSLKGVPAGHVVLRQPDGSIWSASSPTSNKPVHHTSLAALEKYYGGKLGYRGWTEDVNNKLVVKYKEETKKMVDETELRVLYRFLLGRDITQYGRDNYLGKVTFEEAQSRIASSEDYNKIVANAKGGLLPVKNLPQAVRQAFNQ